MKRTMTSWLAALAVLLMLAAPAQAEDSAAEDESSGPDANEHGKERSEAARNQTMGAAAAIGERACALVHIYLDYPSLVFDPLLGIIDFDPDQCYDIFVESSFHTWHYRYEPVTE